HTPSAVAPNPAISSLGAMFGFDPQHTRFNPDEHILSPTNVSHLVPYWTAPTGGYVYSSPAVANGVIYVGSDKLLYAFDAKTGQILWSTSTGGSVNSSAAIASGVVYVVADFSRLYAFDATRGKTLWRAEIGYSQ